MPLNTPKTQCKRMLEHSSGQLDQSKPYSLHALADPMFPPEPSASLLSSGKDQNDKQGDVHGRYGQASDEYLVKVTTL